MKGTGDSKIRFQPAVFPINLRTDQVTLLIRFVLIIIAQLCQIRNYSYAKIKNFQVYIVTRRWLVYHNRRLLCSDIILQHLMTSFFMDLNDLHILLWI